MGKVKPIKPDSGIAGRAETIKALLDDDWGSFAGTDHELLAAFTPAERKAILHEVEREEWRRREAAREPVLLERLRTWPVSELGNVFCERPDLEEQLTPERKLEWGAWLRQVREEREKENGPAILPTE